MPITIQLVQVIACARLLQLLGAAGLQFSIESSLQQSIAKVMRLIQGSSLQPYPPGTSVIVIRDPVRSATESKVTVKKRSGSYSA